MNELRLLDPFLRDPFDDTLRGLMRPWRVGLLDGAPRMRIDLVMATASAATKCRWISVDRQARKGDKPSDHAPVVVDIDV